MKAVRIHAYGDTSVLKYEDASVPEFGPDDVLIKVHAAGINPVDWKIRQGLVNYSNKAKFPLILGRDVSGVIEKQGALVTRFKPGDKVISVSDPMRDGSYAEYMVVQASNVAFAPKDLPLIFAAGIPLASQTAWVALFDNAQLKSGQNVLILGGSGGVGTFAVQLVKIAGANVLATTSTKNIDFVKSLGADVVIDYQSEDIGAKAKDIDVVFDTIGGDTQSEAFKVIRKGGTMVSTLNVDEKTAEKYQVKAKSFLMMSSNMMSNGARLQEISGLIDRQLLKVKIDSIFPLTEAKAAHKLSQTHKAVGKIILEVT